MFDLDLTDKKGILVIAPPRSGTHMMTSILANTVDIENKININEIYVNDVDKLNILQQLKDIEQQYSGKFIIASIAQWYVINLLISHWDYLKDYYIIDLRRHDKIAQYTSWCILQASGGQYNPSADSYQHLLPLAVDVEHVERFIAAQNLCYAIKADKILYYEDVVKLNQFSTTKKNYYPIDVTDTFLDYETIYKLLGNYRYHD
jgi:hypothetical protein